MKKISACSWILRKSGGGGYVGEVLKNKTWSKYVLRSLIKWKSRDLDKFVYNICLKLNSKQNGGEGLGCEGPKTQ